MLQRGGIFAALLALCVTAPNVAGAHLRFPKLKGERNLVLDLSGANIQLHYRTGFGAALADEERKRADRDGDFVVGALESNAAMDEKTAALLRSVSVCTGTSVDKVECRQLAKRDIIRMESEGWIPGPSRHLHVTWTFDLRVPAKNLGAIVVEDGYQVPGLEITDVVIHPPPHAALLEAGDAAMPGGVSTAFTWIEANRDPAKGPRRIVAAWPAPAGSGHAGLLLAAAALIFAAALWFWPRRKRVH